MLKSDLFSAQASTSAANSIIGGLEGLAESLGGQINGSPSVSIGMRKKDYRVDTTGQGRTKGSGVVNFKEDAEAAVEFALIEALRDGVLTGVSDFSSRVLKAATNLDKAADLAFKYENVIKSLANFDDPIGSAVRELNKSFDQLRTQMMSNGATTSELANVERLQGLQRKELLTQQLQDFQDFKKELNGEGSGATTLDRLNSKLNEFSGYQSDLAAGKTVDQSAFTSLGQEVFGLARDVYGTATNEFQNIRSTLTSATETAIANSTKAFDAANASTVAAADKAAAIQSAQLTELEKQTNLLSVIKEALSGTQSVSSYAVINSAKGATV